MIGEKREKVIMQLLPDIFAAQQQGLKSKPQFQRDNLPGCQESWTGDVFVRKRWGHDQCTHVWDKLYNLFTVRDIRIDHMVEDIQDMLDSLNSLFY